MPHAYSIGSIKATDIQAAQAAASIKHAIHKANVGGIEATDI